MIFKGVLIDFGDTLAYLDEAEFKQYEEALIATLKKYGYKRRLEDLASVLANVYWKSSRGELKTPKEFWEQMLVKLKIHDDSGLPNILQRVRNYYETRIWKLYAEAPAALSMLKKKYKLALVSNCAAGTDKVIRSLGLTDFFDCITLSFQVGVRKPDKRIYLEALKCLGSAADETVFVADEISDLEGAREIGLKTMLVLQGRSTFQEAKDLNFKPDYQISRISEISKIL